MHYGFGHPKKPMTLRNRSFMSLIPDLRREKSELSEKLSLNVECGAALGLRAGSPDTAPYGNADIHGFPSETLNVPVPPRGGSELLGQRGVDGPLILFRHRLCTNPRLCSGLIRRRSAF